MSLICFALLVCYDYSDIATVITQNQHPLWSLLPCIYSTRNYEPKHKQIKQQKAGKKTWAIMHLALYSYTLKKNNCSPLPLFHLYMMVGAAEHTLAWHPRLKWTDTINPRDSGGPLTEQDKVSASAHRYTWPVAHEHSLALMAYIMCTSATTDCNSIGSFLVWCPCRIDVCNKGATFNFLHSEFVKSFMGWRILSRESSLRIWQRWCSIFCSFVCWTS